MCILHLSAAIINKCLSGKTTALESLRLLRAQILWGMYHNKQVDYVYLLWEDLVFQVENKNSKKNNDMCYPHFTKVIFDYFMAKDQAIPRRNKKFWHYARDDFMFTTIRSEAFKTYRAYATGEKAPKSKATKKKTESKSSPKTKPSQASKEQMKLATKRSLTEFHVSHASGLGNGLDLQSKVPDESESEEESWTFSQGEEEDEDDDQDNDSERTESDNDGDDFVHPKLSTYRADDQEEENEDEKSNDDEDQNQ
ncbi:hypothetical protein Tco_1026513, partial [Tanacetum coccineum]